MTQFPIGFRFPQDLVDILLVAFLIYRILLLVKGTRAFQVLLGLIVLVGAYVASKWFELVTLNWILKEFLSSFIILVVILFQSDIRRALAQMGKQSFFGLGSGFPTPMGAVDELVGALVALSHRKLGAIIVIERQTRLKGHVEGGTTIDAHLSRELIQSIFQPGSPVHDGAVTIEGGKVMLAGAFLPLTVRTDLANELGTRHRAAIGITEETDAVAVVVSEERAELSLVVNGKIKRAMSPDALKESLADLLDIGARDSVAGQRTVPAGEVKR